MTKLSSEKMCEADVVGGVKVVELYSSSGAENKSQLLIYPLVGKAMHNTVKWCNARDQVQVLLGKWRDQQVLLCVQDQSGLVLLSMGDS